MIMSFLLGFLAGYFEPQAAPHIKQTARDVFDLDIPEGPGAYDKLALLILLAAAALLQAIWGQVWALPLITGAFLGVFAKPLYHALTTKTIRTGPGRD